MDANGVTLNINYGALPCVRANPTVNLSPSSQSAAPDGNAGFSVTVLNNDSAGCAPAAFQMSSLLPSLWNALFSTSPLSISPGSSSGTTMTVYVPAAQTSGSNTVTAKADNATDPTYFGTKDAGFNVVSAPITSVDVPPGPDPGGAYPKRSNVTTTAEVMSGGSPAAGASVNFTLSHPSGSSYTGTATAGSNGQADWTHRFKPKDPEGQWTATALATWNSMASNTDNDDLWYVNAPVPCTYANPTVVISPSNITVPAGSSADYTVTVTNNDSSSCSAASFSFASSLPGGWTTSFNPTSLSIGPGQSATSTMTKTVPAGATGSNQVDASAASGSYSGSATATFTVGVVPPLTVSVSVNGSSFAPRSTVTMTALVGDGNPVSGASVVFTLTKATGSTITKTATTNSSGVATSKYRLRRQDPSGTYSVSATATYNGSSAISTPDATFTVQ